MPRSLAVAVAVLAALACTEQRESSYATHAELLAAGEGARSWFPEWLPGDATNLRESHDLDTNRTIGRFTAGETIELPQDLCRQVSEIQNPGAAGWWPDGETYRRLEHYICEEPQVFGDGRVEKWELLVAVDREAGDVFFARKRG